MNQIHRINDFSLLKFIENQDIFPYKIIKDEISLINKQFLNVIDLDNTVWNFSSLSSINHTLNKTFSTLPLFSPTVETQAKSLVSKQVNLVLKQGFTWGNVFGLHVIIKSSKSNDVLISKIVKQSDFNISANPELIDGSFWLEETIFNIPSIDDTLECQITTVTAEDITSTGTILNYPYDYVVLIDEKPIPDYIQTQVSFDENNYLDIVVSTTENKTVEQSILDTFELEIADIKVSHLISYGNDIVGYTQIRVSNENNVFNKINVGLNLVSIFNQTPLELVKIHVSTEILVDNKLIKREALINTDMNAINPFLQQVINDIHPTTNYPVSVVQENVVNNTIIEAKQNTKIIPIYQPVFIEFIKDDLIFSNKKITFDKITKPTYLFIAETVGNPEQYIATEITADNKYYFDLSKLQPLTKPTKYELLEIVNLSVIGSGSVLLS